MWTIYILQCKDKSYYTGITNNLEKRLLTHQSGKGSKYVRSRLPFILIKYFEVKTKSLALKIEYYIKSLPKHKKLLFELKDYELSIL